MRKMCEDCAFEDAESYITGGKCISCWRCQAEGLEAENAKLRADIVELTRKGEALCCQNGNLLMDNAKLREVAEAAKNSFYECGDSTRENEKREWNLRDALKKLEAVK